MLHYLSYIYNSFFKDEILEQKYEELKTQYEELKKKEIFYTNKINNLQKELHIKIKLEKDIKNICEKYNL